MQFPVDKQGDVVIVRIALKKIDAANAQSFKLSVQQHVQGNQNVILDLTEVMFVDSSGLGAILSCLRGINAENGQMRLCSLTPHVRILFELVRMHRVFDIFPTREEALASFVS